MSAVTRRRKILGGILSVALLLGSGVALGACTKDADIVNDNIATDADNFKILRRTVAYNGITGEYLFTIEGFCSVDMDNPARYSVTCKIGNRYVKNLVGKSDNVTVFSEQLDPAGVSPSHYNVIFKPSVIIPTIEGR